jgi:hypothetical protein
MKINPYGFLRTTFLAQQIRKPHDPVIIREKIDAMFYDMKAQMYQHEIKVGLKIDVHC